MSVPDQPASDDPVITLWGVAIGAAAVILAQLIAELVKWRVAKGQRSHESAQRRAAAVRDALAEALDAAEALRAVLVSYEAADVPGNELEQKLSTARSAFQVRVYQVDDFDSRENLLKWAKVAQGWANGDDQRSAEDHRWTLAVQRCGEQIRKNR